MTWDDLNQLGIDGSTHVWIVHNKRHYDAECPEGVDNFFDLPLFSRYKVAYLRSKGVAADDIMTEDIAPPPLCPINNPVKEDEDEALGTRMA
nr:hypothetical protein [Methylomarinum sp. Ch1-1]MDP4523309.1 hypothetical protein [Methylomarinum sp. Ch1-1]